MRAQLSHVSASQLFEAVVVVVVVFFFIKTYNRCLVSFSNFVIVLINW